MKNQYLSLLRTALELIYTPNYDNQNYPFPWLKILVKKFERFLLRSVHAYKRQTYTYIQTVQNFIFTTFCLFSIIIWQLTGLFYLNMISSMLRYLGFRCKLLVFTVWGISIRSCLWKSNELLYFTKNLFVSFFDQL